MLKGIIDRKGFSTRTECSISSGQKLECSKIGNSSLDGKI